MDCSEWLAFLRGKGLLVDALPADSTPCDNVLVDGTSFINENIGHARSSEYLAALLCKHVETVGKRTSAAEASVHFDLLPRLPYGLACTWSAKQQALLENALDPISYGISENLYRFSECLHGGESSTEWPRAFLKEPESRRALWRHPLLEWQLVHGTADTLMAYSHYPPTLKCVIAAGVPHITSKKPHQKWRDTWVDNERVVESEYAQVLEEIKIKKGLLGASAATWAKFLLTTLTVGYRHQTHRQWPRHSTRTRYPTLDSSTDVYHQMSQMLYTIAAAGKTEGKTPVVLIENARDEALPVFFLLLHRVRESAHALRLILNWSNKPRPSLDLTATYERVRQHLQEAKSFTVPDLCLAMIMQNSYTTGAHPCETDAALVWEALHHEFLESGCYLVHFREKDIAQDVFARGVLTSSDSIRSECFRWCVSHFSTRHFAAAVLAVSAHRLLEALKMAPTIPRLSRENRQSDSYIHRLYRESAHRLPTTWTCGAPMTPLQALARARRANWLIEYYLTASFPAHLESHVLDAAFSFVGEKSVWGLRWVAEDAFNEEDKLYGMLYDFNFRLRPQSNRKGAVHVGRIALIDTVTLR